MGETASHTEPPNPTGAQSEWLHDPESGEKDHNPTAAELIERYAPKPGENKLYNVLLDRAADGTLGFNPLENVYAFADAAGNAEHRGTTGVIEIPVADGTALESLPMTQALQLIQQVRMARSLGFRIEGDPFIEDGKLKLNFELPRVEGEVAKTRLRGGRLVDNEPGVDSNGDTIPAEVMNSLQAASYYDQGVTTFEGQVITTIPHSELRDLRTKMSLADWLYGKKAAFDTHPEVAAKGLLAFDRAIGEAMGYQVGKTELVIEGPSKIYKLPLLGIRPGFER